MTSTTQATTPALQQNVGIGKAFGTLLSAIVMCIMFVPRLVTSANKAMDIVDDVLDAGKSLSGTMKDSAEDFRNTSAAEAQANHVARMKDVNQARTAAGLEAVELSTSRTISPAAQAALDKLGVAA